MTRLEKWVVESSGWSDDDKKLSEESLREALATMLSNNDEAWPISVNALRVLAEAATLIDPVLTIAQRQAFAGAAKSAIRTVIDNAGQADELNSEAGEVETLEKNFRPEPGLLIRKPSRTCQ